MSAVALPAVASLLSVAQGPLGDQDEADLRAFALFAALTVGAVFFLVSTALRAKALREAQERRATQERREPERGDSE